MKKTKIIIAGIGGVGGYYGGLLARKYFETPNIEIFFIARGENLKRIRESGLKVITESESFIAYPKMATDNPEEIGEVDFILLCTKSYHLNDTIIQLKPCIKESTIILPLLNGATITEQIKSLLPENKVWYGCVYIVSRLNQPGEVESSGGVHDLFFGNEKPNEDLIQQHQLLNIMLNAGIKAFCSSDIRSIIWKKFIFISTTATLTTYFNVGFRDLLTTEERKNLTLKLLTEISELAKATGITFDTDIIQTTLKHISRLPFGTTSSMHTDFLQNRKTELETLTGIVPQLANQFGVKTPTYQKIYESLKSI